MLAKGNPYDNAYAESFFKTLKNEEVCLWEYETFTDVVERIPEFIEKVYNRKRVHSGIQYFTGRVWSYITRQEQKTIARTGHPKTTRLSLQSKGCSPESSIVCQKTL